MRVVTVRRYLLCDSDREIFNTKLSRVDLSGIVYILLNLCDVLNNVPHSDDYNRLKSTLLRQQGAILRSYTTKEHIRCTGSLPVHRGM